MVLNQAEQIDGSRATHRVQPQEAARSDRTSIVARTSESLMDKKKRDLQDVMKEEGRRGRRPLDSEAQRAREEKLGRFRKLLEMATEEEFVMALRAFGLREGSQEFLTSLEIWRNYRS
jgi:hypothetical protein